MRPEPRRASACEDETAAAILKDLYRPLYLIETPIVVTDVVTAELIKYASNAFLATKISFINEMADLCEAVGRRRARRRPGHGARPAHRPEVPASRARATAARASPRTRGRSSSSARDHGVDAQDRRAP